MRFQCLQVLRIHFQVIRIFLHHTTSFPIPLSRNLLLSPHNAPLSIHNPRFRRRNPLSLLQTRRTPIQSIQSIHCIHCIHCIHWTHRSHRELRSSLGGREVFDHFRPRNAAIKQIRIDYGREYTYRSLSKLLSGLLTSNSTRSNKPKRLRDSSLVSFSRCRGTRRIEFSRFWTSLELKAPSIQELQANQPTQNHAESL